MLASVTDNKQSRDHSEAVFESGINRKYISQVFIGETLSARVSHLHIRPSTTQTITKTKSSGLCVSTGTGSTSWHTSINRLSQKNVEDLINILKESSTIADLNPERISEEYNRRLVFEPGNTISLQDLNNK